MIEPRSTAWLSQFCVQAASASESVEHYAVNTDQQFGELIAIIVSVRHRNASQLWFLQRVVVVSNPNGPHRAVRCFPCHDVVLARVTLRTGNGKSHLFYGLLSCSYLQHCV